MVVFPSGLEQPAGSARFGLDALLLASFAVKTAQKFFAGPILAMEGGCGCGAASLGFAVLRPESHCIGIDSEKELVLAATFNARSMNLDKRCLFVHADLADMKQSLASYHQKADLFFANPPWRKLSSGHVTNRKLRKKAYWQQENGSFLFIRAADYFLRHKGRFCLIIPSFLLGELFGLLSGTSLGLRYVLPVVPFVSSPVKRFLLLCQKNAGMDYEFAFPLVIHKKTDFNIGYTEEAREFCPWL